MNSLKSATKTLVFTIILICTFSAVEAKSPEAMNEQEAARGFKFSLSWAGVGGSFYTPDMGYWNSKSEIRNWSNKFGAMPIWGANLDFKVYNRFHLRAEGGVGQGTASQPNVSPELGGGSLSKTVNLVPLDAILIYQFMDDNLVIPYIGAGGGTVFVTSSNERNLTNLPASSSKSTASDYMGYAVAGVKMPAASHLYIGAEVRGAFGSYQDQVTDTHQVASLQTISLSGFQMAVTLNYRF